MSRKPGRMYRRISGPAYTRREYMGGVPGIKVVQFDMGNVKEEFPVEMSLIAEEACQIRHSALEAARVSANRFLLREVGDANYHLKLRVYPHHVLRENKQATGAGADRVSDGMRRAFGKAVGTAARVKAGQKIFTIEVKPEYFLKAKDALRRAGNKLPTPYRIIVERGEELVLRQAEEAAA
ncbi:MAG: 50S ribosomal protein L16 [Methanocellales archaeon]